MSQFLEIPIKFLCCVLLLPVLRGLARGKPGFFVEHRHALLKGLLALGALAYVNFGFFHEDGTPIHLWDQFHYTLGSKYFPELGYDGLYAATIQAIRETHPSQELPSRVRDLATNNVVPIENLEAFRQEVRARFTPERWRLFCEDIGRWKFHRSMLHDHGYNATPPHVAISRVFSSTLPFRMRTLYLLALLDFALLGLAGWALVWGFGIEAAAMVSLCFGLGFCSRYYWVGGAFLRMDYLAALAIALACIARGRYAGAGVAAAYSACVRIFPILFPLALVAAALFGSREIRARIRLSRFLTGFGLTAILLLSAGTLSGRGCKVYGEFANRIRTHSAAVLANDIGVRVTALASLSNLLGKNVDPASYYDLPLVEAEQNRVIAARGAFPVMVALAISAWIVFALRRIRSPEAAFVAGGPLVFSLLKITWYYGAIFALTVLIRPIRSTVAFLATTAATYFSLFIIAALDHAGFLRLYGFSVAFATMIALAAYFLVWLRQAKRDAPTLGGHGV